MSVRKARDERIGMLVLKIGAEVFGRAVLKAGFCKKTRPASPAMAKLESALPKEPSRFSVFKYECESRCKKLKRRMISKHSLTEVRLAGGCNLLIKNHTLIQIYFRG